MVAGPLQTLAVPDSIGVNIHFTSPKPGEMKMLADGGFKWVRMDLNWSGTEKAEGEYDFAAYDGLLKSCDEAGVRAVLILDYHNKMYDDGQSPHTDDGRAAFAKWAAAAATHFKGRGVVWEMYNEPNIQFWTPQPNADDYVKLAVAVGKALHDAAPEETYIGPACSRIDTAFLEHCFKGGLLDYWSAVSVHPYRQTYPEAVGAEYCKLRQLVARYAPKGKTIPIVSGEWGYSAGWAHFDPQLQAKYLPREMLVNLYNEVPVSIWYDWKDDGADDKDPEHHFGAVGRDFHEGGAPAYDAKPAYVAMKALNSSLGGLRYNKRLAIGDSNADYVLVFDKDSDVRLAVWTTSKEPHALTIPASEGAFRVVDSLGKDLAPLTADATGLTVTANDTVQYVIPQKPNDLLRLAAALQRAPLDYVADGGQQIWLTLDMHNPLTEPIGAIGATTGAFEPHVFPIDPGGVESIRARGYILRDTEPQPVAIRIKVRETGILTQWTNLVATNPLRVTVMPVINNMLTLELDNPGGDAFTGIVSFSDTEGKVVQPRRLEISGGEKWATIQTPFEASDRAPYRFGVRIEDADHNLVLKTTPMTYRPVDHFARFTTNAAPDGYTLTAEGDAKVTSEQALTASAPSEGTPLPKLGALQIKYSLDAGKKYLRLIPQSADLKQIEGQPTALGMWIYGDGQHEHLRARFVDSTGQVFQSIAHGELSDASQVGWKGWQFVTFPLSSFGASHWGGTDDGEVHYPIKLDTLLVVEGSGHGKTEGALYLAEPVLMYP